MSQPRATNVNYRVGKPRRTNVPGEWKVPMLKGGKPYEPGAYYTDDKQDALDTAKAMEARLNKNPKTMPRKTVTVEYNTLGYTVMLNDQPIYRAGNNRQISDASASVNPGSPAALSLEEIKAFAIQTGQDLAKENRARWGGASLDDEPELAENPKTNPYVGNRRNFQASSTELTRARIQADANKKSFGHDYGVFFDTSGRLHVERLNPNARYQYLYTTAMQFPRTLKRNPRNGLVGVPVQSGDIVRVSAGSGVYSNKIGKVIKTQFRSTPAGMISTSPGSYRPTPGWITVQFDDGSISDFPANRLFPNSKMKTNPSGGRMDDPTADEMRAFIKQTYAKLYEFDRVSEDNPDGLDANVEAAIYWFAYHYHGGQWSNLYSALSTSPYRPGPLARGPEPDSAEMDFFIALQEHYAPGNPTDFNEP